MSTQIQDPLDVGSIEKFRNEGILLLRDFFDRATKDMLRLAWRDLQKRIDDGRAQHTSRFVYGEWPLELQNFFRNDAIVQILKPLLGDDIALYSQTFLLKNQDHVADVTFHQELPYYHGGTTKVSVFIPFAPVFAENGAMTFVIGSHKFGNIGCQGNIELEVFPDLPLVTPSMDLGDIMLMDYLLWHGSTVNEDSSPRPLMHLVYQRANDGSHCGKPNLVSGQWRTTNFLPLRKGIVPNTEYLLSRIEALEQENEELRRTSMKPSEERTGRFRFLLSSWRQRG